MSNNNLMVYKWYIEDIIDDTAIISLSVLGQGWNHQGHIFDENDIHNFNIDKGGWCKISNNVTFWLEFFDYQDVYPKKGETYIQYKNDWYNFTKDKLPF